ncbi:Thymidylate synthase ThyX [uncultured archaeon]|nr:Thymidylate synthase ThyX [uncultured archaeon]
MMHLQQSLRREKILGGYYLPDSILESSLAEKTIDVLDGSLRLYDEMVDAGIPEEDARYILPLYVYTFIQTTTNARELTHLDSMNGGGSVPPIVRYGVDRMVEEAAKIAPLLMKRREYNYEKLGWWPSAQLYSMSNQMLSNIVSLYRNPKEPMFVSYMPQPEEIANAIKNRDEAELANLKHIHNGSHLEGILVMLSLVSLHQEIRQRTLNQSVEPIFTAVARRRIFTPPNIGNSAFKDRYVAQAMAMLDLYPALSAETITMGDVIGVVPHALMVYDLLHVNGFNSLHYLGKRKCTKTQYESRVMADKVGEIIKARSPALAHVIAPQGDLYGRCPEKDPCGLCRKASNVSAKKEGQ